MTAHGELFDFDAFDALTFDCYGTLIDWETGLLTALHAVRATSVSSRRRMKVPPVWRACR